MSAGNFREKGLNEISLATECHNAGNAEEALFHYQNGLELLTYAIKYETNAVIKTKLIERVKVWMERAENLKREMQPTGSLKGVNSPTGSKNQELNDRKKIAKPEDLTEDRLQLRSALQSVILSEKPNVSWDEIAGLEQAKNALKEAVIIPMKFPQLFTGNRTPWRGILLFGPPGTGKSQLAKAVATEAEATFFSLSSSDLVSKYLGESERLIKELFQMAREQRPSIIFIDEIDSLCGARGEGESDSSRRIKTEFLVQMQGVGNDQSGILVLGATNMPWALDSGIRRRFERRIYIPLPDLSARVQLVRIHLSKTEHSFTTDQIEAIAAETEGFSGADISALVRDALYEPIRKLQMATHFKQVCITLPNGGPKNMLTPCSARDPAAIEMSWTQVAGDELLEPEMSFNDLLKALNSARKTVSSQDLLNHEKFSKEFGIEG